MQNRNGQVATLLTLGLVIVGSLITLGTSLFVSNNKNNLSSNSKAASSCSQGTKTSGTTSQTCSTICGSYDNYWASSQWIEGTTRNCCCKSGGGGSGTQCEYSEKNSCTKDCPSKNCSSDGCGKDGNNYQTYKCLSSGGGEGYPADDSCWIVKCIDGKAKKMTPAYTTSLSQYDMPLSSCPDGSPYSGGGWTVIGSDNADAKEKTFDCQNGNEEITLVPTEPPAQTCGNYNQGDHFCLEKKLMWCNNGKKKQVGLPCAVGCKDNNDGTASCISYGSTPTPGTGTPTATETPNPNPTLPTVNDNDDQKCINAFKTPYAYCGQRPCAKQDNVDGKVTGYKPTNYACGYVLGKTYNCCIRQDMQADLTLAPTNKFQPTTIPETGDKGDDQKCKDKFGDYSYCTMGLGCIAREDINGKVYEYVRSDYVCNTNIGKDFYCCKLKDYIAGSSVSTVQEVVTQNGERGALINIQGRGIVFSNL